MRRTPRRGFTARRALGAVVVTSALLLSGCGGSESPADKVPELGQTLDEVDDAIVDGDYAAAESAVDDLVAVARSAAQDGELDEGEVEQIRTTAAALVEALRSMEDEEESPAPSPTPTEEPSTPEPSETETEDEGDDEETPTETPEESPSESETEDGDGDGIDLGAETGGE